MFFSVNKKILYSLLVFLIILVGIFFVIFINLYSQKLQDNQNSIYMRNQYVVDLLYENIRLQKELQNITVEYPQIKESLNVRTVSQKLNRTEQELSREQKLNAELQKNYDNNQEAIITGAKIVGLSLFTVILFIIILFFLLDRWVIFPIEKLISISRNVSQGIFSSRIAVRRNRFWNDEFDILYTTFNRMLDNIEQNLQERENRENFLQQLIDTIPDGIRVIDKNYKVLMANKAFYKLLQIKKSCINKKCYQAYGYTDSGCPLSKYNCPLHYFEEKNSGLLRTVHEVGKIPLYVNADVFRFGADKNDYYIVEALHDLSRDVRFSHEQKVSSLAFLSTSIAHEMKNNLGAIRMIIEGVLDSEYKNIADDNEGKKYLLMAYKQLVDAIKTPERLLRIAQYSESEQAEVNVENAVKDMMLMLDYDAKKRGISINTNIDSHAIIRFNEADFKMIILNLAQNAIKAMPNGGSLNIGGKADKKQITLTISDTGIGIEAEKMKHIFEPFYSANDANRSSGLGLAIVSSLIKKAQGTISVKSRVGKGTEFKIKLPLMLNKDN